METVTVLNDCKSNEREKIVRLSINALANSVNELSVAITSLKLRLDFVMVPEKPEEPSKCYAEVGHEGVPIAGELQDISNVVQKDIARLQEILFRLEI